MKIVAGQKKFFRDLLKNIHQKLSGLPMALIAVVLIGWGGFVPCDAYGLEAMAVVDKNQISRDDSLFLRLEVTGSKAQADMSVIQDFKVVPRGSSSLTSIINGKFEKKITYQYILMPLREGDLVIPPITVTEKGKTAVTQLIRIKVAKVLEDPDAAKAIFAKSTITKTQLVEGQHAVYSLSFFTSRRLAGVGFQTPPDFKGLSVKTFEKETSTTQQINGVPFQVTRVDYLIVPTQKGTFTIDPAVLVAKLIVKSNQTPQFDSFFNDSFFSNRQTRPVKVVSNPVTITVSALPEYKADQRFSGLIGQFDIETTVDHNRLTAGESLTLSIKISGTGNIMDAGPPAMDLPAESFKTYDDNPAESIHLTPQGYEGHKLFKRAIVPVKPGKFTLPGVSLTFFDVDQGRYRTILTQPIALDVVPSQKIQTARAPAGDGPATDPAKQTVAIVNKDILQIKEGLHVLENYQPMNPMVFILALLAPAGLFFFVKLALGLNQKEMSFQKQMRQKARSHLKQAEKTDVKDDSFLGHVYSAIVAVIYSKADKKGENITLEEARTILQQTDTDPVQIKKVAGLLATIESARFGNKKIDDAAARDVLKQARTLFKVLCIALIVFGYAAMSPPPVSASSSELYFEAVKSYQQGAFEDAAIKFEKVAKTPINNPHLFYNIGNAYLKSGDIGRAVLWYERARRLAPNDPDLNFNLAFANSRVKDKKEDTVNLMDIVFFWDTLVGVKSLQIAAILLSAAFFTWAGFRTIKRQPVFSGTGMFLFALFIVISAIGGIGMIKQSSSRYAVVVAEQAYIRSGMASGATRLFSLHAGTRVKVDEVRGQYLKIQFSKDKVGWVKATQAEII